MTDVLASSLAADTMQTEPGAETLHHVHTTNELASPQPSLPNALPSHDAPVPIVEYPLLPELGSRLSCMIYSHKGVYGTMYTKGGEYINEPQDNERLTFVGAAALQLYVGLYLYERYPKKVVGFLSVRPLSFLPV